MSVTNIKDRKRTILKLNLGQLMEKESFATFSDLRKESYVHINKFKEKFTAIALYRYDVGYSGHMSRREKHILFEANKVDIVNNKKSNRDEIYKDGQLIAYWNKDIELCFVGGQLVCKVDCWIR